MQIIAKDTKGGGTISSIDTLFADSWFIRVKTSEEVNAEVVNYFGPAKKSKKGFFLATLVKLTIEWPGGYHIVMKITPRVTNDIPLMAIRYKCISQKVLADR